MARNGFGKGFQRYIVHQKFAFIQKITLTSQIPRLLRILLMVPLLGWVGSPAPDDRHRLFFTGQANLEDSDIFSLQPDGTGLRRVTRSLGPDSEPSRSRDGQALVYTCGQDNQLDLCRSDPDGKNIVRLNHDEGIDLFPALSPDGKQLAWMSEQQKHHELYVMDALTGRDRRQLTQNGAYDVSPSWSPDGQQLVFVSNRDGNYEIYRMALDGSQVVRLTHSPATDSAPAWSPDGQWILYIAEPARNQPTKSLYRMRPDGSEQTRLTDPKWHLSAPAWSADSQWIVFGAQHLDRRRMQDCLWLLPAVGGTPVAYEATQGFNPSGVSW
jgi:Tol biopolymer transport system component